MRRPPRTWASRRDRPRIPGPGFGLPPPDTGNVLLNLIARAGLFIIQLERRFDPFFRPLFDKLLRGPLTTLTTFLINLRRKDEGLALAEERIQPDEEESLQAIIDRFTAQMNRLWNPGHYERGGNTKTHGIVRAEFVVRDDLPEHMRRGIYAEPRTFRAWVRFSGPGPYITRDIDDVGFMSISVKLLGVPGPKLLDDEQGTLDMFGVSTPTFVTPDTKSERAPPVLELPERGRVPLRKLPQPARPRLGDAAALDEDAVEPARGRLLQLRPVSPG